MLSACQDGGYEDKLEDKKRHFENSTVTDAGIQRDCQRCSRAGQGQSRTFNGQQFSRPHDFIGRFSQGGG